MGIGGSRTHIGIVSDRSPTPYGAASAYYRLPLRPVFFGKKTRPMGIAASAIRLVMGISGRLAVLVIEASQTYGRLRRRDLRTRPGKCRRRRAIIFRYGCVAPPPRPILRRGGNLE